MAFRSVRRLWRLAPQARRCLVLAEGSTPSLLAWARYGGWEANTCTRYTGRHAAISATFANGQHSIHTTACIGGPYTVVIPSMGESITEGSVASLEKKPGDSVFENDVLAQIETDKVTIDVRYTEKEAGTLKELLVSEGDTVTVGQGVAVVEQGGTQEPAPAAEPAQAAAKPKEAAASPPPPPPPSPPKEAKPPSPPSAGPPEKAVKPERRVKMTRLRARVAERLKGAQNTYAMLTTFNEIDMTNIMQLRADFKDAFLEQHGVKLGFMSAFVKAAADALVKVPAVNGVIDGDEIIYRDYTDISIAVATPKGLVVPVLRNVDNLSFAEVEKSINLLGKKAREGTISIDEMAGGTFTISNGGVYGSLLSTPIINPPQSAILGMHSINQRAMVMGKDIVARPIMNVALTYDHRLIDGREAVTFLKRIKEIVEDPRRLLLDV